MTTKTEAAGRVRNVLQSIKDRLAQTGGSKLNEATTRAHFLNPLLDALGYQSIDDIEFEHYLPDGKTFLDYRLIVNGKARVSVEAKALDSSLTDKDAAQVISYAAILGDEWAVLTNARRWDLYHAFAHAPLADKRILSVDLTSWNSDAQFDAVFEQLWLISRDSFSAGDGPGSWLATKKLDQLLRSSLVDPKSPEVKFIRKRVDGQGISTAEEQIAAWFKRQFEAKPSAPPVQTLIEAGAATHPSWSAEETASYDSSATPTDLKPSGFWIIPAGKQAGYSATEHLKGWLAKGFWGFGPSTPGRRAIKTGDWVAFYAARSHVVLAYAQIAGDLDSLVEESEWPGPGSQSGPIYKVPLDRITWLQNPISLDGSLRATLDAFKGKDPAAGWSWLVQTTHRLSKADFLRLTGLTESSLSGHAPRLGVTAAGP